MTELNGILLLEAEHNEDIVRKDFEIMKFPKLIAISNSCKDPKAT